MRKALFATGIIAVVISFLCLGQYCMERHVNAPERLIIGKWESSINSYEFMKEGNVKIITPLNISTDGEYSINTEKNIISITYSLFGLSYTNDFKYAFNKDKNTLTLTDTYHEKISKAYKRVTEE